MGKVKMNELAPVAPPCYASRSSWVSYLEGAQADYKAPSDAVAQRVRVAGPPLIFEPGQPVRFNREFAFCKDCTAQHSLAMERQGKCRPLYLLELLPAPSVDPSLLAMAA